ncbi:MAG: hypothetical protein U0326_42095 [Polyangiales bacterium]
MHEPRLAPCERCRRHVFVDDARCPFCAASCAPLRAAMLAASLLTACPTGRGSAEVYGAPPPPAHVEPHATPDATPPMAPSAPPRR